MRTRLTLLIVAVILVAGCASGQAGGPDAANETPSTTDISEPARTTSPAESTSTTRTTDDDPPKGSNLLSLSEISNETASNASDNATANFSALDPDQREVFLEAYECDCNVEQSVFRFNDEDRIEYVRYKGQWYFLRVAIV